MRWCDEMAVSSVGRWRARWTTKLSIAFESTDRLSCYRGMETKIKREPNQDEETSKTAANNDLPTGSAVQVKGDSDSADRAEEEVAAKANMILEMCKNAGNKGVLNQELSHIEPHVQVKAINLLLDQGSIELAKKGNQVVYRVKSSTTDGNKGSGDEEKVVYSIVQAAGNKGIWLRDIRSRSSLSTNELNKVIKSMESKKIIKAVKSVSASKKKSYMLYDLEPDSSVTGGAWYSAEQSFETEFVEILSQQCHKFLVEKRKSADEKHASISSRRADSYATSLEVLRVIENSKISRVQLSRADIEMILEKLVYDGLAERCVLSHSNEDGVKSYRSTNQFVTSTGLMKMPCGVCPVSSDCHEEGDITPVKCIYFTEWF